MFAELRCVMLTASTTTSRSLRSSSLAYSRAPASPPRAPPPDRCAAHRSRTEGHFHTASTGRVENALSVILSPDYARFHAPLPRPEGPRQSLRFVAGVRHTSCTEMHYSPRNKPKRDPSPSSVFLCSALPLPFLLSSSPPGARPARANGGRSLTRRLAPSCP